MSEHEEAANNESSSSDDNSSSSGDCEDISASTVPTPSTCGGASAASTTPADRQQVLGGPAEKATHRPRNGRSATVTFVSPVIGKNAKRSWVWQVFHQISPLINKKTKRCVLPEVRPLAPVETGSGTNEVKRAAKSTVTAYMTPCLSASARSAGDCRFVIWCGINLRPQNIRNDDGYNKLHVGALCPDYVESTMSEETFNSILSTLYTETCDKVTEDLRLHRESCLKLGFNCLSISLGSIRASMRARGSITFPFSCHAVEFSPFDDDRVAVATAQHFGLVGNGRLHVVHRTAVSGELSEIRNFDTQAGLNDCAWSECHPRQLVTAGADGAVKLWDLATTDGFPVADWREHAQDVSGVDWNLISKDAFSSASWDGTVRLWHPGTPSSTRTFPDHGRHPVYGAVWCPFSASQLLSSSGDGTARVLDVNAPSATVIQLNGHGGHEVLTADWDKYSHPVVATGCADGAVRTWDLRRPSHPLAVMLHHRYAVKRVRCSTHPTPAGLVASASYDMSFVLWNSHANPKGDDSSSGLERCVGHTEFVTGLAFSFSDPRLLATCALDRRLCFWSTA